MPVAVQRHVPMVVEFSDKDADVPGVVHDQVLGHRGCDPAFATWS